MEGLRAEGEKALRTKVWGFQNGAAGQKGNRFVPSHRQKVWGQKRTKV